MRLQDIIAKKRDGGTLDAGEIAFFIRGYAHGNLPDYQAAALMMAIYLRGMEVAETAVLTREMADSGRRLDLSGLPRPTVDKHSTGGVGDKTSLVVVPILAAAGIPVCKMSGRGLGHTGGTLDKLESIPGFRVDLDPAAMVGQVARVGACLAGQTADLAPADKKIYALRDATATVGSLPLIVSSILSKKLAGGADRFLFDVKVGSGALVRTEDEACALARALVEGAAAHGKPAVALLTDMSQPLGSAVGNALEVREAIETLTPGGGPPDPGRDRFRDLCLVLAAEGIALAKGTEGNARAEAEAVLRGGDALRVFRKIVAAQGGDVEAVDDPAGRLPRAPFVAPVTAPSAGRVRGVDAAAIGNVVVTLGGGRAAKEDRIDPAVGVMMRKRIGDPIAEGEPLAEIHGRSRDEAEALAPRLRAAFDVAPSAEPAAAPVPPLVLGRESSGALAGRVSA
jgi:pyrimidine-nucleoside phosphorylase